MSQYWCLAFIHITFTMFLFSHYLLSFLLRTGRFQYSNQRKSVLEMITNWIVAQLSCYTLQTKTTSFNWRGIITLTLFSKTKQKSNYHMLRHIINMAFILYQLEYHLIIKRVLITHIYVSFLEVIAKWI